MDDKQYFDAIQHVNDAVAHSDPAEWWPHVVDRQPSRTTYLIEGENYAFNHDRDQSHQDLSHGSAYIRLLKSSAPCTLYATHNKTPTSRTDNLQPLDVIVGYVDDAMIVPAWEGRCVFPWIGGVWSERNLWMLALSATII